MLEGEDRARSLKENTLANGTLSDMYPRIISKDLEIGAFGQSDRFEHTTRGTIFRRTRYLEYPFINLPFLRLTTPRATSPVTFHESAVTPVTAAGNRLHLVTAAAVVVVE